MELLFTTMVRQRLKPRWPWREDAERSLRGVPAVATGAACDRQTLQTRCRHVARDPESCRRPPARAGCDAATGNGGVAGRQGNVPRHLPVVLAGAHGRLDPTGELLEEAPATPERD
jgi:hypothetical protein